jgi:hypothetical protein
MTLNQLVCRAASVYPEAFVLNYWDMEKQAPKENRFGGDTLAQFIAFELAETFEEEASDGQQIATAVKAMQTATDDLQAVTHALSAMCSERMAA